MTHATSFWNGTFKFGDVERPNHLVNSGADLLVNALSGIGHARVTHIYLRFGSPLPGITDVVQATADIFRDSSGSGGALYIPLLCPPTVSSSKTGTFTSNRAQWEYSGSPTQLIGEGASLYRTSTYLAGTKLYAIGIVSEQRAGDRKSDVLVGAVDIESDDRSITEGVQFNGSYILNLIP